MANKPNNPSLWSKAKSLAKQKFDVYPSAYANGWAAKWYKGHGGSWRKAEYGMQIPYMEDGGKPDNPGFNALPPAVQQKIIDNMAQGGEKMPPEIARARFAAAGNLDKLDDYGYAYGGYIPEMAAGGWAQQAAIAIAMKKAGKKPKSMKNGGDPNTPYSREYNENLRKQWIDFYNPQVPLNSPPRDDRFDAFYYSETAKVPKVKRTFPAWVKYDDDGSYEYSQGSKNEPPTKYGKPISGYKFVENFTTIEDPDTSELSRLVTNIRENEYKKPVFLRDVKFLRNEYKDGGEADGGMALGQIDATIEKLQKLRQFIQPNSDLEPWVNSKLTLMDDYSSAVSDYMTHNPEAHEEMKEPQGLPMEQMKNGGIPQRYKNMGFTHVGQKKQGDGKHKWKVLAKKGDQYKVVQGGWRGMQDFSQHHSNKRKERFWDRMGGRNSSKATDPFSPLYWHKRFGTWEEGGEIDTPEMKAGGSTFSGNAWYSHGGNIINDKNMFTYPFLPMAQDGTQAPPRQEDYPDYGSFASAMDNWVAGQNYQPEMVMLPEQSIEQDTPGGIPRPLPIELRQQSSQAQPGIDYKGVSIVDLLGSVNKASDFNSRISLAEKMNIKNYRGTASQNMQMVKNILTNPSILNDYTPVKSSSKKAAVSKDVSNDQDISESSDSVSAIKPVTGGSKKQQPKDEEGWSLTEKGIAGIGILGALSAAGLTAADLIGTDFERLASSDIFKGIDKRKLTIARKKLIDEAFKSGVTSIEQAQQFYKKLPARAKKIINNLDAMEIPNTILRPGSAARNVEAYMANQASAAEDAYMASRNAASAIPQSKASRSFIDMARTTGKNIGNFTGKNAKGLWNTMREAYGVARATPWIKLLRKEEGGEKMPPEIARARFAAAGNLDKLEDYGYAYGGYVPMMQVGGDPDSTFENVIEFLDPTGISAWDDVDRTFSDPYAPWWEKGLAVLSATPVIGKVGKVAKGASELSKLAKVTNKVGKVITPVAQMDKYINPASRFVGTMTGKAIQKAPKPIRILGDIGSQANQTRRFFTGADLLFGYETGGIAINPANKGKFTAKAKASGMGVQEYASKVLSAPEGKYPASTRRQANFARNAANWNKEYGGLVEGDIIDVNPEDIQMLKAGGYTFEILD